MLSSINVVRINGVAWKVKSLCLSEHCTMKTYEEVEI
jgi:hypothetical protein